MQSINESIIDLITNSYKNDMIVFEALLRSDARELAYDRIIKESSDAISIKEAKEAKKENSENTKKGLKETIQNVLYKISDTICKLLDKIADAIQDFKRNHIKKYVEKNKDAFMKADLSKLPEKKVKLFLTNNAILDLESSTKELLNTNILAVSFQAAFGAMLDDEGIIDEKKATKEYLKALKNKDLAKILDHKIFLLDKPEAEDYTDVSRLSKKMVIDTLTEENAYKGLIRQKNEFRSNMSRVKSTAFITKSFGDGTKNAIKYLNIYQRNTLKSVNILTSMYKQNLSTCFSLFKKGVALSNGDSSVTSKDPETRATEENAITNEFNFIWESCFER